MELDREPGLEQWRRLAALYDPLAAGEESGRQQANLVSAESLPKIDDLSHTIPSLGKILNNATVNALETRCLKTCRLAFLLSMCPTDLEKELAAQQHLFQGLCTNDGSHCDSYQQPYPRSCLNDDGKI